MPKNITITNIDEVHLSDKANMGSSKKRPKMIHEQLFDQYGIDPTEIYKRTGLLKTIPPEWIPEIIIMNIKSCKIPMIHQNINLKDRIFSFGFETPEACEEFYKEFISNMNLSINKFLTEKSENPKKFNRIIVTETKIDNIQITIQY